MTTSRGDLTGNGCDWFESCFTCPLPRCRYEVKEIEAFKMWREWKLDRDAKRRAYQPVWISDATIGTILQQVCEKYDVTAAELCGPSREMRFTRPRQEAMRRLHRETELTLQAIGLVLGGRDHSTVMHGLKKAESLA